MLARGEPVEDGVGEASRGVDHFEGRGEARLEPGGRAELGARARARALGHSYFELPRFRGTGTSRFTVA